MATPKRELRQGWRLGSNHSGLLAGFEDEDDDEDENEAPVKPKAPVTYQVSEQPSIRVQEEEFAKQLRLARYLAAASLPPVRLPEAVPGAKTPKRRRPAKPGAKAKAETVSKKLGRKNWRKKGGVRDGRVTR
jgi:hypothetical protein